MQVQVTSRSRRIQRLAVDLCVAYVKADGSRRPKVFKLGVLDLAPRANAQLTKILSFAQHTTRRHFPGSHPLSVIVNGAPHPIGAVIVLAS